MGFFSRLRSLFGSDVSPDGRNMMSAIFPSGVPPRRGSRELMIAYRNMPWLHAAIHKIGDALSGTSWRLYRRTEDVGGTQTRHIAFRDPQSGGFVLPGAVEVTKHPFLDLLRRPNPTIMRQPFWGVLAAYDDLKGEVPIVLERDQYGKVIELWPTPPHWLNFTPTENDPTYKFVWNRWKREVPEADVLYLSRPDPENPYGRGCGNGEALADELDVDEFAAKHMAGFFYNRALPDAFIALEGVKSQEQAEAWEQRVRNKYRGSSRAWQFHVTNAKMTVTTIAQNFKQLELQALRENQRDVVLQVLGFPPEVFGIVQNSNRATIDAADFIFQSKVMVPRLNFFAGALTELCAADYGDQFFIAYESPVQEDQAFRLSVMSAQPSLYTKNEWRALSKHPPREGWDDQFGEKTPGAGGGGLTPSLPGATPADPGATPALEPGDPTPENPSVDPEDDDGDDATKAAGGTVRRLRLPSGRSSSA